MAYASAIDKASKRGARMMITIRRAKQSDLESILALEESLWEPEQQASRENIYSRLHIYRNGVLLAFDQTRLVASFFAIKRQHIIGTPITWLHESGYGSGNTHEVNGNSLFSLSITVAPHAPPGTYRKMMMAWRDLAKQENCHTMYAGSRLPGLKSYHGKAEDYLEKVRDKQIFDPILSKANRCGFQIGALLPNYFHDPASLHFGVEIYQYL